MVVTTLWFQSLISLEYNLERIIDDWVLMGFLVGNDFIPHLPHMHIAQDALPTIWKTYKQMLPIMGGYLNDKGKINMVRLEQFLVALAEVGTFSVSVFFCFSNMQHEFHGNEYNFIFC